MRKKLIVVMLFSLLGGCSNSFIYNQMDWLIPWYVSDFLNLNSAQEKSFKHQLVPVLDWHRQEELRNYRLILDQIISDLDKPVTDTVVDNWVNEFLAAYDRLKLHGIPLVIGLAEEMSDLQIQYLMEDMFEDQSELEKRYLGRSEKEFRQQTYENFVEGLGRFLGDLEKPQLQRIQLATKEIKRFDLDWLTQRRTWLTQLNLSLERKPGWQDITYNVVDNREQFESERFKSVNRYNRQIVYAAVAAVIEQRSETQDEFLRKNLTGFRDDIDQLILGD